MAADLVLLVREKCKKLVARELGKDLNAFPVPQTVQHPSLAFHFQETI